MSITVTQNQAVYNLTQTLEQYNLHHSGDPEELEQPIEPPNERADLSSGESNPPGWETEYRGVPAHRPIDRTLDFEYRNTTQNNIERFFIANMFRGIQMVSVSACVVFRQP